MAVQSTAAVVTASLQVAGQVVQLVYEIYKNHRANSRHYADVMAELEAMRPFLDNMHKEGYTLRDSLRLGKAGTTRRRSGGQAGTPQASTLLYDLFVVGGSGDADPWQ